MNTITREDVIRFICNRYNGIAIVNNAGYDVIHEDDARAKAGLIKVLRHGGPLFVLTREQVEDLCAEMLDHDETKYCDIIGFYDVDQNGSTITGSYTYIAYYD